MNRRGMLGRMLGALAAPVALPVAALLAKAAPAKAEALPYAAGFISRSAVHEREGGEWVEGDDGTYWYSTDADGNPQYTFAPNALHKGDTFQITIDGVLQGDGQAAIDRLASTVRQAIASSTRQAP